MDRAGPGDVLAAAIYHLDKAEKILEGYWFPRLQQIDLIISAGTAAELLLKAIHSADVDRVPDEKFVSLIRIFRSHHYLTEAEANDLDTLRRRIGDIKHTPCVPLSVYDDLPVLIPRCLDVLFELGTQCLPDFEGIFREAKRIFDAPDEADIDADILFEVRERRRVIRKLRGSLEDTELWSEFVQRRTHAFNEGASSSGITTKCGACGEMSFELEYEDSRSGQCFVCGFHIDAAEETLFDEYEDEQTEKIASRQVSAPGAHTEDPRYIAWLKRLDEARRREHTEQSVLGKLRRRLEDIKASIRAQEDTSRQRLENKQDG